MLDLKNEIRARLAPWQLAATRENEVVEELAQHLEEEYERALSRGATEEEAEQVVREELENEESLGEQLRKLERRRRPQNPVVPGRAVKGSFFAGFSQDLRYGLRLLVRHPGFTIIAEWRVASGRL